MLYYSREIEFVTLIHKEGKLVMRRKIDLFKTKKGTKETPKQVLDNRNILNEKDSTYYKTLVYPSDYPKLDGSRVIAEHAIFLRACGRSYVYISEDIRRVFDTNITYERVRLAFNNNKGLKKYLAFEELRLSKLVRDRREQVAIKMTKTIDGWADTISDELSKSGYKQVRRMMQDYPVESMKQFLLLNDIIQEDTAKTNKTPPPVININATIAETNDDQKEKMLKWKEKFQNMKDEED